MAYPLPEPDPQDLVPVPTTFVEVNGVRLPVGGAYETVQRLGLADPGAYLPGGALFQGPIQPAGADMPAPRLLPSHAPTAEKPTIGPSQVGERYEPPSWGEIMTMDNPFLGLMEHLVGPSRPSSVATQDPYGASAFLKGAGPPPLMIGSTEAVGGLYSRVEKALGQIPEAGAHPNKILSILKSSASPEEVAYRGVPEFLAGKTRVTRGELQAHLAEHPAPVPTVTTLGVHHNLYDEFVTQLEAKYGEGFEKTVLTPAERTELDRRWASANQRGGMTAREAKYSQYQVPGGENYRETLLTLPTQKELGFTVADEAVAGAPRSISVNFADRSRPGQGITGYVNDFSAERGRYGPPHETRPWKASFQNQTQWFATPEEGTDWVQAQMRKIEPNIAAYDSGFKGGHWDEPNIVVHTRANERTLPTGERGRFVEEVQSDWHQKGKKEGYAKDTTGWTAKSLAEPDAGFTHWEITDADGNYVTKIVGGTKESAIRKAAERGVPDAPFKESWPDLGLKQQLLEAAQDPDAQWLGFTSGQTQADRYNLRKQISALYYDPKEQRLIAMGHESSGATGAVIDRDGIAPEQLADYVGKEAAQKLIDAPLQSKRFAGDLRSVHALTDTELEVGGEGMKHFYDNVLPKRLEKIVKPFGGTVERTTLKTMDEVQQLAGSEPAWIVRLTPAMKARILKEGLPLMALAPVALAVSHEQQPPPKAPPLAVSHPAVAATFPRFTEALDHTRTR